MVVMKMIRYPPLASTLPGQFGVGAHTDFGGVTVLLQEPERHGLEVWVEEKEAWLPVKALEDVYVINCGDMIMKWSGGQYKSAKHRVINKADNESRMSCATFFHGDMLASNPLNPNDPNRETVGQLLIKRFRNQFSIEKDTIAHVETKA
jgi:isopenicillin N synthase-like dioxygenase